MASIQSGCPLSSKRTEGNKQTGMIGQIRSGLTYLRMPFLMPSCSSHTWVAENTR